MKQMKKEHLLNCLTVEKLDCLILDELGYIPLHKQVENFVPGYFRCVTKQETTVCD
ncbi:hypothetical protein [Neobacillus sp. Marseille-QA0830]